MSCDDDMLRTQMRALERENRQLRRNLRDEFAAAALTGLIAHHGGDTVRHISAETCFEYAEAMLEARKS